MLFSYLIVILASVLVGFINTLAGSGSLIMLPLLMGLGLSAPVANGTNRVAIFFQSLVGANTFFRHKKISIGEGWWLIGTCVAGAMVGAYASTQLDPNSLKQVIGALMILMLILLVFNPEKWLKEDPSLIERNRNFWTLLLLFVIGFYGGFIQAGIGLFLMASLVLGANYSLGKANAFKLIIVFAYALPVLFVFIIFRQVNWQIGLITSAGQALGAYLGARFAATHPQANLWVYRVLLLVIVISIIQFYELWKFLPFYSYFSISTGLTILALYA